MNELLSNKLICRFSIALIQAIALYVLYQSNQNLFEWPASHPYVIYPLTIVMIYIPLMLIQSVGNLRFFAMIGWGLLATLILYAISFYSIYRQDLPGVGLNNYTKADEFFEFFFTTSIVVFIAQSLLSSSVRDRRWIATYTTYFNESWKIAVQALFTMGFTAGVWFLLALGIALFNQINLSFFQNFVTKSSFAIPATVFAVATGLHITDVNTRVTEGIRSLCLTLLSWLLPLIALIVSVFILSLFYTGLQPILQLGEGDSFLVLTAMVLIVLINAVYQDGAQNLQAAAFKRYSLILASFLLIPILFLAIYALINHINQEGWSIIRIYNTAILVIILTYTVGYLIATCRRLQFLECTNIATSFLVIAIYLLFHSPVLDPARLFVADQVKRLRSGQIAADQFNFYRLKFTGLRYGYLALQEMQKAWTGDKSQYIRDKAKETLEAKPGYYATQPALNNDDKKRLIILNNPNEIIPESFYAQSSYSENGHVLLSCLSNAKKPCHAWVKQDNQNKPLIILMDNYQFLGFQQDASGRWIIIGSWRIAYSCRQKYVDAMKSGDLKLIPAQPAAQDIEIMGLRVHFINNEVACP